MCAVFVKHITFCRLLAKPEVLSPSVGMFLAAMYGFITVMRRQKSIWLHFLILCSRYSVLVEADFRSRSTSLVCDCT